MTFIEIEQLSFSFPGTKEPVIHDFSLSINQGEVVGILGASGSGKTTLLRIISGLEVPKSGKIKIAGKYVVDENTLVQPEHREVGMVFQDYVLFPHMTISDNILFGLFKLTKKDRLARLKEVLELVKLEKYEKRYPHELSGGQQQRVALARALAPKPKLLLLDEPFSNLDAELKETIREELRMILKKANMTCILVTHDHNDVEAICDRIIIIDQTQTPVLL
jgi:iron(III) transport system ATP-binding protein